MKNDSTMGGVKISVPPTLLVSAVGQIDDVRRAVTLELKAPGDAVFLLGTTHDECGRQRVLSDISANATACAQRPAPPAPTSETVCPDWTPQQRSGSIACSRTAISDGLVRSAATPGKGRLGDLTFARCVMAGRAGHGSGPDRRLA